MDSVSQALLGAACGELVLGRRLGRRAILIGAALGTLPDLDVLVPYEDAIDSFTYHRGWSHSVFVLSAASLPLAALARRFAGGEAGKSVPFGRWWLGVWLVLFTHPLLDSLTTYGTQIWWPLPLPPVAIGSTFIIDPLFTLPLAIGVILAWRRRDRRGRVANRVGLLLGTGWLGLTLLSQAHATRVAHASLGIGPGETVSSGRAATPPARAVLDGIAAPLDASTRSSAPAERAAGEPQVLLLPFPFALLWRVLVIDPGGETYREGWYSLLDERPEVRFDAYDIGRELLDAMRGDRRLERLDWFTDGFVRARERGDGELALTDLRIGAEGGYIFSFVVAERDEGASGTWRPVVARNLPPDIDPAALGLLIRRTVDERVELRSPEDGPSPTGRVPTGGSPDAADVPPPGPEPPNR